MNPLLAQGLAFIAPFLIALLTKAEASNRVRAGLSLVLVAGLTIGTFAAEQYPAEFEAVAAQVAMLVAIVVGSYQTVQAVLGDSLDLNELLLADKGIG